MSDKKVVVRYAPSPTGRQHIGGIRTALYNYLYAKKEGGTFILRIEDTDQTRLVPQSEDYILQALEWLGITPDNSPQQGGPHAPYRQSERKKIYQAYAQELVDKGKAYYAFDDMQALDDMRERLKAQKVAAPKYNAITRTAMQNSLTLPQEEVEKRLKEGKPYIIRLLVNPKETIKLYDQVRGWIKVQGSTLDDKVLLKEDGMPTYHLASVVDDHLMEVTHIIRGEEWLPSAPLHTLLYQAFGWETPTFVHLPLILRKDGKGKLSKRMAEANNTPIFPLAWQDEDTKISYQGLKEQGFLPDAVLNFLALLGWHPSSNEEIFTLPELIEAFTLEKINKAGARFDLEKAQWINQQHIKKIDNDYLAKEYLIPELEKKNIATTPAYAAKVCSIVKERIPFLKNLTEESLYFFITPKPLTAIPETHLPLLSTTLETLAGIDTWTADNLQGALKTIAKSTPLKPKESMPFLRKVITGQDKGPALPLIIETLGKKTAIARIQQNIQA